MTRSVERGGDELRGLTDLARSVLQLPEPPDNERAQLQRLVVTLQTRAQRRTSLLVRVRRPLIGVAALAAAAVLLVIGLRGERRQTSLSYTVASGLAIDGPTPRSRADQYLFSDGSSVSVAPRAALAVESASARRPRVRVVRGATQVRIVHRRESAWTFAAGPFEVLVTGTKFALSWDPDEQKVLLQLMEGSVVLRGPHVDGSLAVRSGQRVTVSLLSGRVVVGDAADRLAPGPSEPADATARAPAEGPAPAPHADEAPGAAVPRTSWGAPVRAESWRALVKRGAFREVIAAARSRPLKSCMARCSAEELRALGDAARYSNQTDVAALALRTLRRRFVGTSDATVAAFLLGRTYESRRQWRDAGDWYRTYLTEAPDGELAVEASSGRARVAAIRGLHRDDDGQGRQP